MFFLKMKKFVVLVALVVFIFNLLPAMIEAAPPPPSPDRPGLVPCGGTQDYSATPDYDETKPCQLCHIFFLFNNIVSFLLIPNNPFTVVPIVLIIAFFMIIWAGFLYVVSWGNPGNIGKARDILEATGIGLLIVYGAWAAVNTLTWFHILKADWFSLICPIV